MFSVDQRHTYRRQVSRLSSSESTECPDSIFDYCSTHPSVDLDDLSSDAIDLDDISVGSVCMDVNMNARNIGSVILEEEEQKTTAEVTARTAVHVDVNCKSVAPSSTSETELLPSLSGLPSSSRMQSRLPAPRSRATAVVVSGSQCASKSDQLANGLTLTSRAGSSISFKSGSKVGPSRFH